MRTGLSIFTSSSFDFQAKYFICLKLWPCMPLRRTWDWGVDHLLPHVWNHCWTCYSDLSALTMPWCDPFNQGFPGAQTVENLPVVKRPGFDPWRRGWLPTPVFLPAESHGQRSLESYSPWGRKELDTTEQLTHTHTHGQRSLVRHNWATNTHTQAYSHRLDSFKWNELCLSMSPNHFQNNSEFITSFSTIG